MLAKLWKRIEGRLKARELTKAIPGSVCQKIHDHMESFPVKETHYANRNIKYLSADLNVKIMHSLFKAKHCDIQVHYEFYLKYFHKRFSYHFGTPRKYVCATSEELSQKIKAIF